MKEIKDLLQENHLEPFQGILDIVYRCFEETGDLVEPMFFFLTKEEEKFYNMPVPVDLLNSPHGKLAIAASIKSFKEHLIENLKQTPYCFIMITEVYSRKLPKDFDLNSLSKLTAEEVEKIVVSTDDCVMIYLNHMDGDLNILVDKIENEDGSFVVNPERKSSFSEPEVRDLSNSKFNMFKSE